MCDKQTVKKKTWGFLNVRKKTWVHDKALEDLSMVFRLDISLKFAKLDFGKPGFSAGVR